MSAGASTENSDRPAPPEDGANASAERRTRWGFRFSSSNTWRWNAKHPSGVVRVSAEEFRTLADCVADAITQGYVPRPGSIERREARKDLLAQD